MNASYPAQTRDARTALLLLAATLLLFISIAATYSLSRLDLQDLNLKIPTLKAAPQSGPAFQALRPPEPPSGGGRLLTAVATPTSASPAGGSRISPLPTALPVATPPDNR